MSSQTPPTYRPLPLPDRIALPPDESLAQAQDFLARMRRRHTVRDFSTAPVERAVIEAAVLAAGSAPSGANHQPWYFTAISDPALKAQIRAAAEEEEQAFYSGGAGDEWLATNGWRRWSRSAPACPNRIWRRRPG